MKELQPLGLQAMRDRATPKTGREELVPVSTSVPQPSEPGDLGVPNASDLLQRAN